MINANLNQFLDTGWFNEATLFYNGYMYWCEGGISTEDKSFYFWVDKIKSKIVNEIYQQREKNELGKVDGEIVLSIVASDELEARKKFLESPIFEGKTFWEVEKEIAWYDEV